jgi:aromatic-L-amino-acid decarboxylase
MSDGCPGQSLFLPFGTGALLVRDTATLLRAFSTSGEYLRDVHSLGADCNFADMGPELSRAFRGLRLWLPLKLYGAGVFRAALQEKLRLARLAHNLLSADGRFVLLDEPQLTVVVLRLRASEDLAAAQGDALNMALLRRVNARGRVLLASTVLRGRVTLRMCILAHRTHEARVREAVSELCEEAAAVLHTLQTTASAAAAPGGDAASCEGTATA